MKTLLVVLVMMIALLLPAYLDQRKENGDALLAGIEKQNKGFPSSIVDTVSEIVYLDTRISMIGLILFGAPNYRSVLRSVRNENVPFVDDQNCLESTVELFEQRCGLVNKHSMKQALANLCNYVSEKAAIEEAILIACAKNPPESHVIDAGHPKIEIIPAPIHGTSVYCGRVSVTGVSRIKLQSFFKSYQLKLVPSQSILESDYFIQVCFHQNDSLGLCQCEEDDWTPLQKRYWSSTMSPYQQRFIDVKFIVQLSGSVTITLDEVTDVWRYVLLVGGITLLFVTVNRDIFAEYFDAGMVQFVNWALRVLAVACTFMSCIDTHLAVCYGFFLCYVIIFILAPVLSTGYIQGDASQNLVAELASSPEFGEWVVRNLDRIKLRPKLKDVVRG